MKKAFTLIELLAVIIILGFIILIIVPKYNQTIIKSKNKIDLLNVKSIIKCANEYKLDKEFSSNLNPNNNVYNEINFQGENPEYAEVYVSSEGVKLFVVYNNVCYTKDFISDEINTYNISNINECKLTLTSE